MIEYRNIHKSFGGHPVLRGVNLRIERGAVHFILGRSGVGKSILIKMLVGLIRPDQGRVVLDGTDVTDLTETGFAPIRKRCQMIFQHATLLDHLTIVENLAMPLRVRFRIKKREAQERAEDALDKVHATDIAARYPAALGPGLRKRVAIARALALEPDTLLYDEPTTGLDPVAARRTDRLIGETAARLNLTSLVVSHDLVSVREIGHQVDLLHEGLVHFQGTPAELVACEDPVTRQFVHGARRRWAPDDSGVASP